jgi:hypothetical protein
MLQIHMNKIFSPSPGALMQSNLSYLINRLIATYWILLRISSRPLL